jgi:hypothetical protein
MRNNEGYTEDVCSITRHCVFKLKPKGYSAWEK